MLPTPRRQRAVNADPPATATLTTSSQRSPPFDVRHNSSPRYRRVGRFPDSEVDNKELYKNLTETICSIERPKLRTGEKIDIKLTDFRPITSYTWIDNKEPTILVPGHPRIWNDQSLPFKTDKDKGTVFIDQNGSRLGTSPLLPLIVAVNHYNPKFHMGDMDFITDRNGLRKLYRWVNQSSWGNTNTRTMGQTFRIDVGLVGKTILLQRWEAKTTQLGGPGYNKGFQKHTTSEIPGCEAGTGHYRIVTFNFGKQKILMRCTTDACLPPKKDQAQDPLDEPPKDFTYINPQQRSSGSEKVRKIPTYKGGFLSVQTVGKLVPQESIIELRTKGEIATPTRYDDLYVQLLFAQVANLYIGRHRRGEFYKVQKTSMGAVKKKAGETMDDRLKLLKKLLEKIKRIVFESIGDGGSLSLVMKHGKLKVLKRRSRGGLLPENVLEFIH